jgi:hypothetical protein
MRRPDGASQSTVSGRRTEDSPLRSPVACEQRVAHGAHFRVLSDEGEMSLDAAADRGLVSVAPRRSPRPLLVMGAVVVVACCAFATNAVKRHARFASATAGSSLAPPDTEAARRPVPARAVEAGIDRERKATTMASAHRRAPHIPARVVIATRIYVAAGPTLSPPVPPEFGFEGAR